MDQDRNPTAQFSIKSYALNLIAGEGGSVSGAGIFNHDSNTSIVATPNKDIFLMDGLETVLQIQMPNQPQYPKSGSKPDCNFFITDF